MPPHAEPRCPINTAGIRLEACGGLTDGGAEGSARLQYPHGSPEIARHRRGSRAPRARHPGPEGRSAPASDIDVATPSEEPLGQKNARSYLRRRAPRRSKAAPHAARKVVRKACSLAGSTASGASAMAVASAT